VRRRGFSLIDAIAAIVMLSVAAPAMLAALASAHRDRVSPAMASQARWLAIEKLEDILADRSSPTRGWDFVDGANYADESSISGFPGFTREVEIAETGADLQAAGEGYKTVTVTVRWTHLDGQPHQVELATVVTELPS
jgi:Tfp pilus assembly protein PilV